jgi:dTDP-4-dehydrorhamnose reductase
VRILCIGRQGQTAQALAGAGRGRSGVEVVALSSAEADLARPATLAQAIKTARPDAVINAGAYNFVDRAETEEALAHRINAEGPAALAGLCRSAGVPFIHMSTDLVFDGLKAGAYLETDSVSPLSAYGRSKAAGERLVLEADPAAMVARVCWVYSGAGSNFISKMLDLARRQDSVRVVCDQVGAPTYAGDIASVLLEAAIRMAAGETGLAGLIHIAADETLSRADMARAIFAASSTLSGPVAEVIPVSSDTFAAPARRPLNAHLSNRLAQERFSFVPTPFPMALEKSVRAILGGAAAQG